MRKQLIAFLTGILITCLLMLALNIANCYASDTVEFDSIEFIINRDTLKRHDSHIWWGKHDSKPDPIMGRTEITRIDCESDEMYMIFHTHPFDQVINLFPRVNFQVELTKSWDIENDKRERIRVVIPNGESIRFSQEDNQLFIAKYRRYVYYDKRNRRQHIASVSDICGDTHAKPDNATITLTIHTGDFNEKTHQSKKSGKSTTLKNIFIEGITVKAVKGAPPKPPTPKTLTTSWASIKQN